MCCQLQQWNQKMALIQHEILVILLVPANIFLNNWCYSRLCATEDFKSKNKFIIKQTDSCTTAVCRIFHAVDSNIMLTSFNNVSSFYQSRLQSWKMRINFLIWIFNVGKNCINWMAQSHCMVTKTKFFLHVRQATYQGMDFGTGNLWDRQPRAHI